MKSVPVFQTEADFRHWLEQNLAAIGAKRVILSQEVCPDYVLEMVDGRVLKVEAELFAVNFKYHRHDPAKADLVVAGYSKSDSIEGVPVIAVHQLHVWEPDSFEPLTPEVPLSEMEHDLLMALLQTGGLAVPALGDHFSGTHTLWIRLSPEAVASFPRGAPDDSIMTVMPPAAKAFVKRYHHALIGAGLSEQACEAIHGLQRRGLAKYRPLAFIAALMDGGIIDHPAWIPTELYPTDLARKHHEAAALDSLFKPRKKRS